MARKRKCDPDTLRALYANRDDDFWSWREAVEQVGIDAALDALGFSKDQNLLWYNEHTGDEETLYSLIVGRDWYSGPDETRGEKERRFEFAMSLENWLPKTEDPNPVMARSLAMSEYDAMQQVAEHLKTYAERNNTGAIEGTSSSDS
jgi:hypothetical protein